MVIGYRVLVQNKWFQQLYFLYFLQCKVGDFHALTDVVFVDPSGFLNLCFNVNKVTYEMVIHVCLHFFRIGYVTYLYQRGFSQYYTSKFLVENKVCHKEKIG